MTTLQQLKDDFSRDLYNQTIAEAHNQGICIRCKQPVVIDTNIFTLEGALEYRISGLCETCFDQIFEEGE